MGWAIPVKNPRVPKGLRDSCTTLPTKGLPRCGPSCPDAAWTLQDTQVAPRMPRCCLTVSKCCSRILIYHPGCPDVVQGVQMFPMDSQLPLRVPRCCSRCCPRILRYHPGYADVTPGHSDAVQVAQKMLQDTQVSPTVPRSCPGVSRCCPRVFRCHPGCSGTTQITPGFPDVAPNCPTTTPGCSTVPLWVSPLLAVPPLSRSQGKSPPAVTISSPCAATPGSHSPGSPGVASVLPRHGRFLQVAMLCCQK